MSDGNARQLRAIIQTQTEIAAGDLELDAVIELADGEVATYRVSSGEVTPADALSTIRVPLFHQEEEVGVLKVYAPRANNFDQADVETLELLSELAAAHMSHSRLFAPELHGGRHDTLTGLLNRRAYEERLPVEIARASRYAWPLSLCLLDLDGFKRINETLGHPSGDRALQQVAALLDESRLTDDCFRIGGDEFALLMPKTCAEDAELAAARLSREITKIGMSDGSLGASFGVAEGAEDPAVLHAMADERLLAAKDRRYRPSR